MIRGLQMSKQGMIAQQKKQDNISNNIVNASTHGYKKDQSVIGAKPEMFIHRLNDAIYDTSFGRRDLKPGVGALGTGTIVDETFTNFSQGPVTQTDRTNDFALVGQGFFTVSHNGEEYLTRDGEFNVDTQGNLVTNKGAFVLGQNGPLNVGNADFQVNEQGEVYSDGEYIDTLNITSVENPNSLLKMGENLLQLTDESEVVEANTTVRQSYLEQSNVNLAEEMVDMLATMRAYEANQRAIQTHDETLGKAVNEIAQLR
ncbi:flagellar hook-basal body complex protein [Proteinivorax hydrogeniformans]|uniref:Flagellar hook-basal body complex protein n=1 Tax=Proteinivorax hydrogeniformans TaxID=1826727 RepID=A0AAU8HTL5_9FIRM